MIEHRYPRLVESIVDVDLDELAAAAGVSVDELRAVVEGGRVAPLGDFRKRVARALHRRPAQLFRFVHQPVLDEAGYVTDADTCRLIDGVR